MKYIKLTRGYHAVVDDFVFESINKHKWHANVNKNLVYARRAVKESIVHNGKKYHRIIIIQMHREIASCYDDNKVVDHIDNNGLNNQKENLRICTQKENLRNRRKIKPSKSKHKGVSKKSTSMQYRATISIDNKHIHLGQYSSEEEAAFAYNVASKKYHREFGSPNDVEEVELKKKSFRKPLNSSSKYNGVCKTKNSKWQASVVSEGKVKYLGLFEIESDAAHAYNNYVMSDNSNNLRELNVIDIEYKNSLVIWNKTSPYKGIIWCNHHKKWSVRKTIEGKRVSLGYFKKIEEAHDKLINYGKKIK